MQPLLLRIGHLHLMHMAPSQYMSPPLAAAAKAKVKEGTRTKDTDAPYLELNHLAAVQGMPTTTHRRPTREVHQQGQVVQQLEYVFLLWI